ncbi:MAG: hypothetical protein ABI658_10940 [Acidimicrobiales bacterium]
MDGLVGASQIVACVLLSLFFQLVALTLGLSAVTDRSRMIASISAVAFAVLGAVLSFASIRPRLVFARQRAVAGAASAFLGGTATFACWLIATTPMPN